MTQYRPKISSKGKAAKFLGQSGLLWLGVGLAVIIFVAVAFFVSRQNPIPFELTGGDSSPVVLLRNEETIFYEFANSGDQPVVLERLIPRIQLYQDQVLVADVQSVFVRSGGIDFQLEEGYFQEGEQLEIQPGETFELGVVYLGQELGWNRIYGFRLQYNTEGVSVDAELELTEDFYIFVE